MTTKLFVGNLSYSTSEDQLRDVFAPFGNVVSSAIVLDRMTGRSRGFGFVEYDSQAEADKAIEALNGADLNGRQLNVNVARERSEGDRPPRRFGGQSAGGGGGYGGGGGGGGYGGGGGGGGYGGGGGGGGGGGRGGYGGGGGGGGRGGGGGGRGGGGRGGRGGGRGGRGDRDDGDRW
ncbi:MAG TPA: RNA-binding protein [Polyangiaceae bacterium]|nr:RNA-binding protein [Polyangiaceae bacterium]